MVQSGRATRGIEQAPGFTLPAGAPIDGRQMWAANRFWMENQNLVTKRYGGKRKQYWYAMLFMMKAFEWGLRRCGQYERGVRNAEDIVVREVELRFARLPAAFDGFTILHISDPHLDGMPGLEERVVERLAGRTFDVCALTGDYRTELHGPIRAVMKSLARLVEGIATRSGFVGVLGNHDDCHMVAPMEAMGIRMLINERIVFERGDDRLQIIGTDDVHYYYTDQSLHALEAAREAFSVALVHSPELFDVASDSGVELYLCGHTHAGQVCLPFGVPLVRHVRIGQEYFRGQWQHGEMKGITSAGVGTSGIPVRFNTRGELLAITLRRAAA